MPVVFLIIKKKIRENGNNKSKLFFDNGMIIKYLPVWRL